MKISSMQKSGSEESAGHDMSEGVEEISESVQRRQEDVEDMESGVYCEFGQK